MHERHPGDEKRLARRRYPAELNERGVRMVQELRREDPGDHSVIGRVARQLGVGKESPRARLRQADIDGGMRPGVTSVEAEELKRLRKENAELKRANEILQAAAHFFGAELDRRSRK